MAAIGLVDYLNRDAVAKADGSCDLWRLYSSSHYAPGFFVSMAALARMNGKKYSDMNIEHPTHRGYTQAIGLPAALGESDAYPYERRNEGLNYSRLVLLESLEATDKATRDVNGCIRTLCHGLGVDRFVRDLCEVVGDLHDNVWSHGKSTGFSMAQRWKKPNSNNEFLFEFSLADCGIGFLRELRRVGLNIPDHQSAIEWCLLRGNSSKLVRVHDDDDWGQRLPPDMMGNPMPGLGRVKESDNHHQGLGLAKLVDLVTAYRGDLWLCSGTAILSIGSNGLRSYSGPKFEWQGVTMACRFDTSVIRCHQNAEELDEITAGLIELLGAENGRDSA